MKTKQSKTNRNNNVKCKCCSKANFIFFQLFSCSEGICTRMRMSMMPKCYYVDRFLSNSILSKICKRLSNNKKKKDSQAKIKNFSEIPIQLTNKNIFIPFPAIPIYS